MQFVTEEEASDGFPHSATSIQTNKCDGMESQQVHEGVYRETKTRKGLMLNKQRNEEQTTRPRPAG
jgi:hypothetical protein